LKSKSPTDRLPFYDAEQCKQCACTVCTKEECNMCTRNPCQGCEEKLLEGKDREPTIACWDTNKDGEVKRGVFPDDWL